MTYWLLFLSARSRTRGSILSSQQSSSQRAYDMTTPFRKRYVRRWNDKSCSLPMGRGDGSDESTSLMHKRGSAIIREGVGKRKQKLR